MGSGILIDYGKVDPWIKKNPEGKYKDFVSANPRIEISTWSFEKRRRHVLNLPLTPSMQPGYRGTKMGTPRLKQSGVYSTVWTIPVDDVKKKNNSEIIQDFVSQMNGAFNLNLEAVQITMVSNGAQVFEIRKYSK